jgi:hypothetical protein
MGDTKELKPVICKHKTIIYLSLEAKRPKKSLPLVILRTKPRDLSIILHRAITITITHDILHHKNTKSA